MKMGKRYLLMIPIGVMIAFSIYFYALQENIVESLLAEKFTEKQEAVDMIAYQVDEFIRADEDWITDRRYYEQSLQLMTEKLDATYMTFAAVYNEGLELVSAHVYHDDSSFDPQAFQEFKDGVKANESGKLRLDFKAPGEQRRDVLVYYRWIPTSKALTGRYLVVVGISRLTLVTNTKGMVTAGAASLIILTTVLNGAMIWLLTKPENTRGQAG